MERHKQRKTFWLISTLILFSVVCGVIWTQYNSRTVDQSDYAVESSSSVNKPLDGRTENSAPHEQENIPAYEMQTVKAGTSFTSRFGFSVYISGSNSEMMHANIFITLENQKDRNYRKVGVGEPIKINHNNSNFVIEINNIKDDLVDLTIRQNA